MRQAMRAIRHVMPVGIAMMFAIAAAAPVAAQEPAAGEAPEPPVTLMFSLKELMVIQQAIREGGLLRDDTETVETVKPRLREPLYLSGIVYSDAGNWTIWLNGMPLRPGEKGNLFEVLEVTDRRVVLLVAWGETTRQVVLEPNQTFVPSLAQVVEGRAAM